MNILNGNIIWTTFSKNGWSEIGLLDDVWRYILTSLNGSEVKSLLMVSKGFYSLLDLDILDRFASKAEALMIWRPDIFDMQNSMKDILSQAVCLDTLEDWFINGVISGPKPEYLPLANWYVGWLDRMSSKITSDADIYLR